MHHSSIGVVEFLLPHILICVGSKKEDFYHHKSNLIQLNRPFLVVVPAVTLTGPEGALCSCKGSKHSVLMMKRVKVSMMKVGMMMMFE